ncbi:hypothetical protein BXZ70DRAFT_938277 [Cristinia sonorae]|uniref:D-serine dehydratase n=1 Tax=Cristinia sonorae TaxID=1940300 RepID=A0A8K0XQJ1_9AGAR|nr:hypothetical protein BXZ70DRAFT_938277 [Cristinia sonorae]
MADLPVPQTHTPIHLTGGPDKKALVDAFKGQPINALRTPAVVIDRAVFAKNCALMHENAKAWGAQFRAHVKTHKTIEGVRLQLRSTAATTHAVVVSTLMEAHEIVKGGLVADETVNDILYGLPVPINKLADLSDLWDEIAPHAGTVRVMVDHPIQVEAIERFEDTKSTNRRWSVFIKVDAGGKRAGLEPSSPAFQELLKSALLSQNISVYGFYCHAGNSYASRSPEEASSWLTIEIDAVNTAARMAKSLLPESNRDPFVLAVGSTPTAHSATPENKAKLASVLHGTLEIHAGNYPLLDLQQLHTGLVQRTRIAQYVTATVLSYYPGRGNNATDEALCDAGAIAMSKDTGPSGSFGEVVGRTWKLGRVSQEHGILTRDSTDGVDTLRIGEVVRIVGQHACLTLAAHQWYYIADSEGEDGGLVVEDVWVPWKGW